MSTIHHAPRSSARPVAVLVLSCSLLIGCAGAETDDPFATSVGPGQLPGTGSGGSTEGDSSASGAETVSPGGTTVADDGPPGPGGDGSTSLDDPNPGATSSASAGDSVSAGDSASSSVGPTTADPCECMGGDCCDGCHFLPSTEVCEPQAESQYDCAWGTECGEDVSVRFRDRYCSGSSADCDGGHGSWSAPQVADACSDEQSCSPGEASCNEDLDCICTYYVTSHECPSYTSGNGTGAGGGEIFEICGAIDLVTGAMTVHAQKYDGTTFGDRPYQVRVSNPGDSSCGPNTNYFVVSDNNPVGEGTPSLTFDFQSQWLPGQEEKAYCVTASTQPGDLGYDPTSAQQTSWWWSDKLVIERVCPP